jgi:hypothetical protein
MPEQAIRCQLEAVPRLLALHDTQSIGAECDIGFSLDVVAEIAFSIDAVL